MGTLGWHLGDTGVRGHLGDTGVTPWGHWGEGTPWGHWGGTLGTLWWHLGDVGAPQFSVDAQKVLALLELLGCVELRVFSAARMERVSIRPYREPIAL